MAVAIVPAEYDLRAIAVMSGLSESELGSLRYRDGRLYVPEIEQSALDAALAAYEIERPNRQLNATKDARRAAMAAACSVAIQAGIVCNALGADHTYPTTLTDQHNLDGTVMAARIDGEEGGPYKFWCADSQGLWARREHTAAQIVAVGKAVRAHVAAQQDRYEQRLAEIDQATAETISTITW
jgi:hypothetical protein